MNENLLSLLFQRNYFKPWSKLSFCSTGDLEILLDAMGNLREALDARSSHSVFWIITLVLHRIPTNWVSFARLLTEPTRSTTLTFYFQLPAYIGPFSIVTQKIVRHFAKRYCFFFVFVFFIASLTPLTMRHLHFLHYIHYIH